MSWLLAEDIPGGGFGPPPDLPPGTGKLVVLGVLGLAGWVMWQTGALDPERLLSGLKNLSPTYRLRRRAYRVAEDAGLHAGPVGEDKNDRYVRNAHVKKTVRELKRDGRYAVYVLIRHRQGLDLSEGSKDRLKFEAKWRHAMTRPDDDGNAAHDWQFRPYVGTSTIACRWAKLPAPEATRLFDLLAPTLKWKEGTRPADVIDARFETADD